MSTFPSFSTVFSASGAAFRRINLQCLPFTGFPFLPQTTFQPILFFYNILMIISRHYHSPNMSILIWTWEDSYSVINRIVTISLQSNWLFSFTFSGILGSFLLLKHPSFLPRCPNWGVIYFRTISHQKSLLML